MPKKVNAAFSEFLKNYVNLDSIKNKKRNEDKNEKNIIHFIYYRSML